MKNNYSSRIRFGFKSFLLLNFLYSFVPVKSFLQTTLISVDENDDGLNPFAKISNSRFFAASFNNLSFIPISVAIIGFV